MNPIVLDENTGSYLPLYGVEIKQVGGNWVQGIIDGHWFEAKVFANPSTFGIENGRISKLTICKADKWEGFYREKLLFNYDRGHDFGRMNGKALRMLLEIFAESKPAPTRKIEV